MKPGSLVQYREREWVVLPSTDPEITMLRPIGGSVREVCGVYKPLSDMAYSLPFERVTDATFPLPSADEVQDHSAVRLMLEASRLLLRDGAAPFRSLGHLSVRPRPYQFVPLLMALRLGTVRLLIADDVGVGKTVEGALVARELLDRGDIRRVAVVCPPYLCDQWHKELVEKFGIDAVVIRSGTVSRLEKQAPLDTSVFQHHTHLIASIDLVKGGRYRDGFLHHCPEFVLVDEAHGAAQPPGEKRSASQQQRHDLLCELARDERRHMVLLTATPHSGMEDSFLSLLGLLRPEFRSYSLAGLGEAERTDLARHFIQRRRPDVKHWMGADTPFPEREPWPSPSGELTYTFSKAYGAFYGDVYEFATDLVKSAEALSGWQARMRFWSALALLRCVTSSPAAAETTLEKRASDGAETTGVTLDALQSATDEELEGTYEPVLYDPIDAEAVVDAQPANVFDAQEQDPDWGESDRGRLRDFAQRAAGLRGKQDAKLQALVEAVRACLDDGYHPIVWCRYIATSDYAAEELHRSLDRAFKGLRVTSVTGAMVEDERRLKIDELCQAPRRVLVATDCLSEGINLQDRFNAIIHYDLPWNPNRLEQREGRVDRFGQTSPTVRTTLIYGQDNPIDGAVLEVLIRKAHQIRRDTGVSVPVPTDSETVMEAVLKSVFAHSYGRQGQSTLFDGTPELALQVRRQVHTSWDRAAEEEAESRSRFAQRSIKPEEVQRELEETDGVLGDPEAVRRFLQDASQRVPFGLRQRQGGLWELSAADLPGAVRQRLGDAPDTLQITLDSPVPESAVFVGRSHPLIEGLAEHLVDLAFYPAESPPPAARCGAIRTTAVSRRTTLLLLRLRFLVYERGDGTPTLAEETLVWGYEGLLPNITPLPMDRARELMDNAEASGNLEPAHRRELVAETTAAWDALRPWLGAMAAERRSRLEEAHQRIRGLLQQGRLRIEPQMPPDLLGVLVLVPVPKAVQP